MSDGASLRHIVANEDVSVVRFRPITQCLGASLHEHGAKKAGATTLGLASKSSCSYSHLTYRRAALIDGASSPQSCHLGGSSPSHPLASKLGEVVFRHSSRLPSRCVRVLREIARDAMQARGF